VRGVPGNRHSYRGGKEEIMKFSLTAKAVAVEDNEDFWLVGFANDEFEPTHYLQLQRGIKDSDQDIRLGMNTYYVEIDDQSSSCYGGIEQFELRRDHALVKFSSQGEKKLNGIETAEVKFKIDNEKFIQLQDRLSKVFAGTTIYIFNVA
jgi:hypothetical protein